jgi:hypothetical protein
MRRRALSLRSQEFPASSGRWNFCRSPRFTPYSPRPRFFPDVPIRSQATGKVIRRHAGDRLDSKTEELLRRVKGATALEETRAAGKAFHLRSRIAAIALTWLRA